jgi:hypothetical protein
MPTTGFELIIPARERHQTHALDRAATGIGKTNLYFADYLTTDTSETDVPSVRLRW